eukprot:s647_g18.t1
MPSSSVSSFSSSSWSSSLLFAVQIAPPSSSQSRSQWALPDFSCDCPIAVGTAGNQQRLPEDFSSDCQIAMGTAGLQQRLPDRSGHCRTSTASPRSQLALPDLNRELQIADGGLANSQLDSSEGKSQQSSDGLLEEAHQQVSLGLVRHGDGENMADLKKSYERIAALQQKDRSVARCEELRRENSQLKRELMRQSRGVLLMEAENNSQNANDLSSFLSSLQDRLSASPRASSKGKALKLSFPELEGRLADATTKASSSLKAVLQGLQKRRQLEPEESLRSQREKQLLEQELFELRLQHLTKGMGALNPRSKGDEEKLQALVACSLQFLQSMSQEMQLLANENTTLRESLLSFSSSLSQAKMQLGHCPNASSMVSAKGNRELESILSSITANAECAVPAVFSRLFNDSRKLDPRLEQQAQERRESLMKSLIYHLRTGGFEDQEETQSVAGLHEPSAPSVLPRSFLDDDHEDLFNASKSSWSRQCSGSSEEVSSARMSSNRRAFLGITSLEFKPNSMDGAAKASRLRIPGRKPEGLMLPQVPMQAGHSPASEQPLSCRDSGDHDAESDAMASSSEGDQDAKPLPQVKPPQDHSVNVSGPTKLVCLVAMSHALRYRGAASQDRSHFFQSQMAFQDRRISVSDLKPPESWPSRMKNALTGRRLSHLVARPEPVQRTRRASVLVTLGGDDHSICQWSLQPRGFEEDLTPTLRHPWAELEGSEAPQDRFAFLGRSEEPTPREDPDPAPRRSRVFQDINQVNQISEEEKRPTGPTGKRFYHHQQSQGVRNALKHKIRVYVALPATLEFTAMGESDPMTARE